MAELFQAKACEGGICDAASCRCLNELAVGSKASVVTVEGDRETRRRLMEMGFCNGTPVEVIRRAPLGDPIEFRVRGYRVSLRNEQAKQVRIIVA